jgi:orotidine-5'-phosphate decarboxylase
MTYIEKLRNAWSQNNSLICVGLDTDLQKIPEHLRQDPQPIFSFNKSIIEATHDLVCAYKPQIAYYSAIGAEDQLINTIRYIKDFAGDIPVILDAKRGDIGATASLYAKEVFERYQADAVTVNPYMGGDTLKPFLDYKERGVIALCRTSNPGAVDLQNYQSGDCMLYQHVARLAVTEWNYNNNISLVVGATYPQELREIRSIVEDMPLLVPGVGAQGGDVAAVINNGLNSHGQGLIINSSRAIIYASSGKDFAQAARAATLKLQSEILAAQSSL